MALPRLLQTREARKKLKSRDHPYYVELRRGLALGYRKGTDGGSWLLREHKGGGYKKGGGYVKRRLAAADDDTPGDGIAVLSWDEAQLLALGADRPTVTRPTKLTVAQAAEAYFDTRQGNADGDRGTYKACIEEPLGKRGVAELTPGDFENWLSRQVPKTEDKEERRAAQATANRRWTVLRAILNSAYRKDAKRVPSADAWRRIRPFQNVDQPRTRTLTVAEVKRLLNALQPDVRALARGSILTGARRGELLAMRVADFDGAQVTVRHSKAGLARSRQIELNDEGVEFFSQAAAGRAGDAPMFPSQHTEWGNRNISREVLVACGWWLDQKAKKWIYKETGAKLNPPALFHDLRRSYGSLMLNSGARIEVIQELLGHADLRMTRRAYAHLLNRTKQRAVKKHLPSFGFESDNVVPLQRKGRKQ
jgi:integrase